MMVPQLQKFLFCFALKTGGYVISVHELIWAVWTALGCVVSMILSRNILDPADYENEVVRKRKFPQCGI